MNIHRRQRSHGNMKTEADQDLETKLRSTPKFSFYRPAHASMFPVFSKGQKFTFTKQSFEALQPLKPATTDIKKAGLDLQKQAKTESPEMKPKKSKVLIPPLKLMLVQTERLPYKHKSFDKRIEDSPKPGKSALQDSVISFGARHKTEWNIGSQPPKNKKLHKLQGNIIRRLFNQ